MLQAIKETVGFVQWVFGLLRGWVPVKPNTADVHRVRALEVTRTRIRWYSETRSRK
jgi:hypothetical protein